MIHSFSFGQGVLLANCSTLCSRGRNYARSTDDNLTTVMHEKVRHEVRQWELVYVLTPQIQMVGRHQLQVDEIQMWKMMQFTSV